MYCFRRCNVNEILVEHWQAERKLRTKAFLCRALRKSRTLTVQALIRTFCSSDGVCHYVNKLFSAGLQMPPWYLLIWRAVSIRYVYVHIIYQHTFCASIIYGKNHLPICAEWTLLSYLFELGCFQQKGFLVSFCFTMLYTNPYSW